MQWRRAVDKVGSEARLWGFSSSSATRQLQVTSCPLGEVFKGSVPQFSSLVQSLLRIHRGLVAGYQNPPMLKSLIQNGIVQLCMLSY